jgi:thiamine biosynthesis lipoprotein
VTFALLIVLVGLLIGCARAPREVVLSGDTMGTTYTVKYIDQPGTVAALQIQKRISTLLDEIDIELSTYRADSALARFNASGATDWVDVPQHLARIVAMAREVSEWSNGSFDITAAPLVNVWGFGPQPRTPPPPQRVAEALANVGFRRLQVQLEPSRLRKELPQLQVDVNGIAPGYTVDLLGDALRSLGVSDFMVEIGGEVVAHGRNLHREPWRIAVEQPLENERRPYTILALDGMAVSTSGDYRHYLDAGGRHYSHIIDPRSGYPLEGPLTSVVVINERAARADALATALSVLGAEAGYAHAAEAGIPALFLLREAGGLRELATPALARYRQK